VSRSSRLETTVSLRGIRHCGRVISSALALVLRLASTDDRATTAGTGRAMRGSWRTVATFIVETIQAGRTPLADSEGSFHPSCRAQSTTIWWQRRSESLVAIDPRHPQDSSP
jgi:hypothetical protein